MTKLLERALEAVRKLPALHRLAAPSSLPAARETGADSQDEIALAMLNLAGNRAAAPSRFAISESKRKTHVNALMFGHLGLLVRSSLTRS